MTLRRDGNASEPDGLLVSDFDYELPPELIAQKPLERRDDSRMMVLDRATGRVEHRRFGEVGDFFRPGDVLVINDTRVIPARLYGRTGGAAVELLLTRDRGDGEWEALCRPARKLRPGARASFPEGLEAEVTAAGPEGLRLLRFNLPEVRRALEKVGYAPLPPYIKRTPGDDAARALDLARYQTVFAREGSAVAAPTAGLHFTPEALEALEKKGVRVVSVKLDVGPATFQPVRVDNVAEHRMLEEEYEVGEAAAREVNAALKEGRRVTAVGTTVVRTLESAFKEGSVRPGRSATSLFIHPGFRFNVTGRLLTNFHLPRSTLLMLVSAFAGREFVLEVYREAVRSRYRFFSYGDCMLIL